MNNQVTGYPHIDQPWRQYYDKRAKEMTFPKGTMYDYFHQQNKDRPNDPAFNYFGKIITFGKLEESIIQCTKALTSYGLRKGDMISICMLNSPEAYILLYGANRIGIIVNYIVINSPKEIIQEQILDTNSKMVFVSDMLANKVLESIEGSIPIVHIPLSTSMPTSIKVLYNIKNRGKLDPRLIPYKEFIKEGKDNYEITHDQSLPAVIVYTSGTTGKAKGAVISNYAGNVSAFSYDASSPLWNFKPHEKFLNILPPFYAYGVFFCIHTPLILGMCVILTPDPMPSTFPEKVNKYKPDHFSVGPLHIEALSNTKGIKLDYLSTAAFGGDSVAKEWLENMRAILREKGARNGIQTGYGMTELAGAFATTTHNSELMLPLLHGIVRIKDLDTNEDLKYNERGEICISTPTMMEYYWNMPEETNEVIFEEDGLRWIRTGDLGYVKEDGSFIIDGRLKRIYWKLAEDGTVYRVYPMIIEKVIARSEVVNKVAVIGIPDTSKGYKTIVYIESKEDPTLVNKQVKELVEKELPVSSYPDEIIILPTLPTTTAHKVDYNRLEEDYNK